MSIHIERFINAETIEEAIRFKKDKENIFVAGSTAIGRLHTLKAKYMINLLTLPLNYIEKQDNIIRIGATTTFDDIENSPAIKEHLPILTETIKHIAAWGIKTMATIGGSIAISFPWSDLIPTLLSLDTSLKIYKKEGKENISFEEFLKKRKELLKKSIIEEIEIKIPENIKSWGFKKASQTSFDVAMLNMAYIVTKKSTSVAVGARPMLAKRLKEFEKTLNIEKGIKEASVGSDIRVSEWWRKEVLKSWLKEVTQ